MSRDETQTRIELIDPALYNRGWNDSLIRRERTPGGVDIIDGKPKRRKGRTDYLLCIKVYDDKPPLTVALIEAKAEDKLPSLGIQQAKNYKRKFNVPFVFSTNGHIFTEYAEDTSEIKDKLRLENFPTPQDLRNRYEEIKKINLLSDNAKALFIQYKGGEAARWYFQDAAIRAALEKIAKGGNRVLLSLATGTGKTVLASQLLYKLAQSGDLKRALFLCDRDELRTQGISKLQAVFGDNAQIVTTDNPQRNARVIVATYQTLNVTEEDNVPQFWRNNYPKDYFSHIIIDECHRSAWSRWSIVLTDNPKAVHIGLTATPRIIIGEKKETEAKKDDEIITAHNIKYFGEPVYEYSIGDGKEDGYLAACEVIRRSVDLDKKEITKADIEKRSAIDPYTGRKVNPQEIEDKYTASDYENKLMLDDRVKAMCEDFFDLLLKSGDPHQKTIIFCVRDTHANQVMIALNNIYEKWCKENKRTPREWFAFQCTGNPDLRPSAKDLIPDLKGSKNSHYIAVTVDLLSTGVDIPNLENVAFFRYIESSISFYQMLGRGTRTGEPKGSKLMFRLYDYTNATRLFGEPFESRTRPNPIEEEIEGVESPEPDYGKKEEKPKRKIIRVEENQFTIQIEGEGVSILCEEDGKEVLVPLDEYREKLAQKLIEESPTIDVLRNKWIIPGDRKKLISNLPGGEGAVRLIREIEDEQECDLYDVLSELGYGIPAKSRTERVAAFSYKNKTWLKEYPDNAQKVLLSIAKQFEKGGIEELETQNLFDESEVISSGGFISLMNLKEEPNYLIQQTKYRLLI